jgi:hypothetical protein
MRLQQIPTRPLTREEVFNHVAHHLLNQKKKAAQKSTCVYHDSKRNLQCAVGCLIPPPLYTSITEQLSLISLVHQDCPYLENAIFLLADLMCIHDSKFPCTWENELRRLAHIYSIPFNPAPIEEFCNVATN